MIDAAKSLEIDESGALWLVTTFDDEDATPTRTRVRFWLDIPAELADTAETLEAEYQAAQHDADEYHRQVCRDYDSSRGGF